MTVAAVLCCAMSMTVLTACSSDDDDDDGKDKENPATGVDKKIVGNWCSNISGKTFAKWNYGDTWQNTEFKADSTGSTSIYYTYEDNAVGIEKYDFTYSAAADGTLTITPSDREVMAVKWKLVGEELQLIGEEGASQSFKKASNDMVAKFDKWSKAEDIIEVPQPSKYTVFVYGNAGGAMDEIIEWGFWEKTQKFLTDHNNVRVICMYKYGKDQPEIDKPFSGKYAASGDIVWFELTDKTDLNKIKEEGMQAYGMGEEAKQLKICNPNTMRMFLEFSSLQCPAEDYVLAIWGHGSGFDAMNDVPGKYEIQKAPATRGVMTDEWVDDEWMDMYEIFDAMKAADIDHFNTLMFHNCFMGNIESLTQARSFADYIIASAHVLCSDGILMTEFVHGLVETGDPVKAGGLMFERSTPKWQNGYIEEAEEGDYPNGDYKMIRTDKFQPIIDASKRLCDRIMALYPTQKEAIDNATKSAYRVQPIRGNETMMYEWEYPFFDLADYAQLLAQETNDSEMKNISNALDNAFKEAFVHYRDVNNSKEHLDHYTLSVCLLRKAFYTLDYKTAFPGMNPVNNYNEGYEKCDFHKLTGWGNWLNTNEQALDKNPQKGGGGKLE
jgi:hypothetical protein